MKKQIIRTFFGFLVVVAIFGFIKYLQISKAIAQGMSHKPPPDAITTIIIKEQSWQKTLTAVGTLIPEQGIVIKVEEPGRVAKIAFESGQKIEKGEVILALDTAVEEANLSHAEAMEKRTKLALDRALKLFETKSVSKDELDNWQAQNSQALADIRLNRAMIERKVFKAPFSGRLGIRKVNLGEYLAPGMEIVSLQSYDKLYINFSFPQQEVSQINVGQTVNFSVDAYPNKVFEGKVTSVNPEVNETSRNFLVQATIENKAEELRPGMFAQVSVNVGEPFAVIAIPITSINYAPYGDSVYVIEKMNDPQGNEITGAKPQSVELGEKKGDLVRILKGLTAGQEVATSGVFKLHPGSAVFINNSLSPGQSEKPHPQDT